MGKKLIIKGADFSENGFPAESFVYLTQSMILSGYDYYINSGKAITNNGNYEGGFIDISTYADYGTLLVKKDTSKILARIAFVTQLPSASGDTILFATGYSNPITIEDDNVHEYSINNAAYLHVMYYHRDAGGNVFPNLLALKN